MRTVLALLLSFAAHSATADGATSTTWTTTLQDAEACVAQSEPDVARAIDCYSASIGDCVGKPGDQFLGCLRRNIDELYDLLSLYTSHSQAKDIAARYDPARCPGMYDETLGLAQDEFVALCEFTALSTQVTAGHIASIWGAFPSGE